MLVTATFAGTGETTSRLYNTTRKAKAVKVQEFTPPPGRNAAPTRTRKRNRSQPHSA